jgi:hypothetical protein
MNEIILRPSDISTDLSLAEQAREQALSASALIGVVRTPEEQEKAVYAQRLLHTVNTGVEKARTERNRAALDYLAGNNARAKEWTSETQAEEERMGQVVADYQIEERLKAKRAEAERQAEIRRIEEERQQALAAAEEKRVNAILAAKKKDRDALREKLDKERQAEEAKQAAVAEIKREMLGPAVEAPRADGQVVKERWTFRVKDLHVLYTFNRGLVRPLEANTAEINQWLDSGVREIPGLEIFLDTKSGVRAGRQQKAIEV